VPVLVQHLDGDGEAMWVVKPDDVLSLVGSDATSAPSVASQDLRLGILTDDGRMRGRLIVPGDVLKAHRSIRLCVSTATEPPLTVTSPSAFERPCPRLPFPRS
jgi:hypothetical protein